MIAQFEQEGRKHVFEHVTATQDLGFGEAGRGGKTLKGLDEPGFQRILDVGLNSPWAGFDGTFAGPIGGRVERQSRAEGKDVAFWGWKPSHHSRALRSSQGDDCVGGAEIDADTESAHAWGSSY